MFSCLVNKMDITKFRQFGKTIVCVGRNYRALAAEQGRPLPQEPIVFLKPVSSYIEEGQPIKFPSKCEKLYHEVELGVVIGKRTSCVPEADVMSHVAGYALCLVVCDNR